MRDISLVPSHKSASENLATHRLWTVPAIVFPTNQKEMDFSLSIISAMRHQEESGYATGDFLHQHDPPSGRAKGPLNQSQSSPVSVECRNLMVSWCYQVVDYCRFRRETVEIAISYLDRFCCTALGESARRDRKIYQLAAMTCLYTACKIHEPEAMDPKLVSNLSRGAYSSKEVEEMESTIVEALQWRLNPPTSLSFVRQLLDLIPVHTTSPSIKRSWR
jgi:Cyclin, N-terminal domain